MQRFIIPIYNGLIDAYGVLRDYTWVFWGHNDGKTSHCKIFFVAGITDSFFDVESAIVRTIVGDLKARLQPLNLCSLSIILIGAPSSIVRTLWMLGVDVPSHPYLGLKKRKLWALVVSLKGLMKSKSRIICESQKISQNRLGN